MCVDVVSLSWPDREERLAVFDWLCGRCDSLYDFAGYIAFNFVHQLHGFDDAQHLAYFDLVAGLDEGWGAG